MAEHKNGNAKLSAEKVQNYKEEFLNAINDNLNTPLAIGVLFGLLKEEKSIDVYTLAMDFDRVFGLNLGQVQEKVDIPEEIRNLAELRWQAKLAKNWADADKYRDEILSKGYKILDSKDGYEITK